MFTHILFPTDGSPLSIRAAKVAAKLARLNHAKLTALHVTAPFRPFPVAVEGYVAEPELLSVREYRKDARKKAEKILAKVAATAKSAGVSCEGVAVESGQPWSAIGRTARARGCDLIVMGSHGRRGLEALVLGSQTNKVLTRSKTPVLVCR